MTKNLRQTLLCAAVLLVSAPAAVSWRTAAADQHPHANGFGEVRAIERDAARLSIDHGPLLALNVPGSTRVFTVRERSMLDGLKVGDSVWFSVEQLADQLVISRIDTRPDEHGDH